MRSAVTADTMLAGFRLESLIGEGAMGAVYLAEDTKRGGRVAVKVLVPQLAQDDRFRRRFLRESQLAASLDHPHIVPIVTAGEEDGVLYLAMQYIEGSDLRELLRREGSLEPERALHLVAQVAEALDAAHAAGLVHRDVKPGNVLLAQGPEREHTYVCDFGLARHVSTARSLTSDRGLIGTIDYIPPEQIEGGTIDGRADVYSLGCVLFECLAGAPPFDRESELSVVFAHLNEPPPPLSELRPELPGAFDAVFATALAKSPDDRYSTCHELVEAARAALQGKTFVRRKHRRRRLLLAAVAVLAAAGAAIGGVLATGGESDVGLPSITQTAIAGLKLGLPAEAYTQRFGGWRAETLTPGFPALTFQVPKMAVYFPPKGKKAIIITTWNRDYRTAKGVGPCSTLQELKSAYGKELEPAKSSASADGERMLAYLVGRNLLFALSPDFRTVQVVALYDGGAPRAHLPGGSESYANYVAQAEAPSHVSRVSAGSESYTKYVAQVEATCS
jgi:tRNA A-37 threonylcarbamoyl transferase component Bud32